jgi:hypothetical protein
VLPPTETVCDAGEVDTVKSGVRAVTVSATEVLWLALPLWPVIVSVKFPAAVEVAVDMVRVDDPDVLIDDALNLAVPPAGKPVTLNDTVPVNPFCAPTLIV